MFINEERLFLYCEMTLMNYTNDYEWKEKKCQGEF